MNLFYSPDITGDFHLLSEHESKHLSKVLRLKTGDTIRMVDGKGNLYEGVLQKVTHRECEVKLTQKISDYEKRGYYLHIAVAPTKNIDRIEWFIEKATEIGIDEITPILCEHSERKVIKTERIEKIMISAMKQSGKAFIPKFNDMISFKELISSSFEGEKFIAHCYDQEKTSLIKAIKGNSNLILIGPEGDFSEKEVKEALEHDYKPVSLGTSRLRTETAALVACHTASLSYEIRETRHYKVHQ